MFKRRKRHEMPGLNTASTADISFMLLIFFLLTTSMDSEKGLGRQLPPLDPEQQEQLQDVDKDRIMTIHIMADDKMCMVNEQDYDFSPALKKKVKEFIVKTGPTHIIELQVDRNADYEFYFKIQNILVRAYQELKDYPQRIQETTMQ